jgi:HD-GYP domain-containing protein (c-di-GMP phosphodiesterase class II)
MRRPVFYDPAVPAAKTAAALVDDEFEVGPCIPGTLPAGVVLTGDHGLAAADPHTRLIGVVNASAPGPWSATWYALVPAGAARPLVARAIANAFADLDAAGQRARLERELGELNAIGIQLSAERNLDVLLDTILTKAREITRADGGSLYLVEENADGPPRLRFTVAQCESVDIPFRAVSLPLDHKSVAGYVALTGAIVNLADAYTPPVDSPFQINRWFDDNAGYRTKSMLVVPMRTPQGETIGALQLINCKLDAVDVLRTLAETEQSVRAFDASHERLAGSLASQAAVAIANRRLYESISQLFDGFVKASVTAIESRDPTTFGHSFRVADLTVGLAEVVDRCDTGPYRGLRFTAEELRELRYASLLHDFGKVGVREHVLVKAKKLYPADLERIRHRIELLMRDLELGTTRRKLDWIVRQGAEGYGPQANKMDAELNAALAELNDALDLILTMNEPSVQPQEFAGQLLQITARSWDDHRGRRRTVITPEEASILAITKGSLTDAERREIQQHVVHTFQFLAQIPWTREFRRIPEIARSHHEKLDGTGYPFSFRGDQIPVQSRMMAIADIYDALTATDRPYKKAIRVEEALDILREEKAAGALDASLLDLFIDARIFDRTDWR